MPLNRNHPPTDEYSPDTLGADHLIAALEITDTLPRHHIGGEAHLYLLGQLAAQHPREAGRLGKLIATHDPSNQAGRAAALFYELGLYDPTRINEDATRTLAMFINTSIANTNRHHTPLLSVAHEYNKTGQALDSLAQQLTDHTSKWTAYYAYLYHGTDYASGANLLDNREIIPLIDWLVHHLPAESRHRRQSLVGLSEIAQRSRGRQLNQLDIADDFIRITRPADNSDAEALARIGSRAFYGTDLRRTSEAINNLYERYDQTIQQSFASEHISSASLLTWNGASMAAVDTPAEVIAPLIHDQSQTFFSSESHQTVTSEALRRLSRLARAAHRPGDASTFIRAIPDTHKRVSAVLDYIAEAEMPELTNPDIFTPASASDPAANYICNVVDIGHAAASGQIDTVRQSIQFLYDLQPDETYILRLATISLPLLLHHPHLSKKEVGELAKTILNDLGAIDLGMPHMTAQLLQTATYSEDPEVFTAALDYIRHSRMSSLEKLTAINSLRLPT